MSLVNIVVKSDDILPLPIAGAVVSLVEVSPVALAARLVTGSGGVAGFDVPDGIYEVRVYKKGVVFSSSRVEVAGDGAYDVFGTLQVLPSATDPRVCRCSGQFVTNSNQPLQGITILLSSAAEAGLEVPKIVDGAMVSAGPTYLKTNASGFVTVDLFRGGEYYLTFAGNDDVVWNFKVPDRSSANLIDLVHPQPVSVEWDSTVAPGNALDLAVGETVEVPFSLIFSDFQTISTGVSKWLNMLNSDSAVLDVSLSGSKLFVTALASGSAQVTAVAKTNLYPSRVPDYTIQAPPLVVVVT
jgi:hypothetical protein